MGNDIAVFTAMCMCWSGYLSTHVAMMDSLHCSDMTGKAIFSHTIGGLAGGHRGPLVLCADCAVTLQWHKDQQKPIKARMRVAAVSGTSYGCRSAVMRIRAF